LERCCPAPQSRKSNSVDTGTSSPAPPRIIDKGVESAKEVAAGAYEAVKEEADKQGLGSTPDSSLVDQVGKVVKATAEKTEAAVRGKLSDEGGGA